MSLSEIIVPETKPATEWVRGRALQKVSPQQRHAHAQAVLAGSLVSWARARRFGRVGTEWQFNVAPPGDVARPLVPDVAVLSYERLPRDQVEAAQIPRMAPDVAVEIISPTDLRADIDHKIGVYLSAGSTLVLLVDPKEKTFHSFDRIGSRVFNADDDFTHPALPGFAILVSSVFED